VLYSKWLPDRGGYAYYETPERRGLGDDLPTPSLRQTSSIGVASTEIGRAMPLGAKLVGYGPLARGSIAPLDRSGLTGLGAADIPRALFFGTLTVISAVAGVFLVRAMK
jgi:hypothetical protein